MKRILEQKKRDDEKLHGVPVANRLLCSGMKASSEEYRRGFDRIKWSSDPRVKYATKKSPRQFVDRGLNVVDPSTGEVLKTI